MEVKAKDFKLEWLSQSWMGRKIMYRLGRALSAIRILGREVGITCDFGSASQTENGLITYAELRRTK